MRDDICSIPVSEVFAPGDGCPICRMVSTLEEHLVDYITGAAMMEPDVRQETNKTGFCPDHFRMMLQKRNRLSVALTMESHLQDLQKILTFDGKAPSKKQLEALQTASDGCFVCDKVEWGLHRLLTEVFVLWQKEPEFREIFFPAGNLLSPPYSAAADAGTKGNAPPLLPAVRRRGGSSGKEKAGPSFRRRLRLLQNVRLPQCGRRLGKYQRFHRALHVLPHGKTCRTSAKGLS